LADRLHESGFAEGFALTRVVVKPSVGSHPSDA
jgi:hypothetical protein